MPEAALSSAVRVRPRGPDRPPATPSGVRGLICLCGIDGAGKTTHVQHLVARLHAAGLRARAIATVSRNGDFMPTLRDVQDHTGRQTMADLIAFERFRRVRRLVVPALARDETIVCDRYFYTDIAYAEAGGCDPSLPRTLLALAPQPDVTVILQAPFEVAIERVAGRSPTTRWAPDHKAQFLRAAAHRFDELGSEVGATCIDTDRPFAVVSDEVYRAAAQAIGLGFAPAAGGAAPIS